MGTLQISCAELLGINYSNNFLGDIFNYNAIEVISLKGRVEGNPGVDSITGVWSGMSSLTGVSQTYNEIIVNGVNLGTGRVISYDFESQSDVYSKPYSISLELIRSGNLFNATGNVYSDVYSIRNIIQSGYINDISEDFSFSTQKSGQYSYSKSLSFRIDSGISQNRTSIAQIIASGLLEKSVSLPFVLISFPDFWGSGKGNRLVSESYDEINGKYAFSESFNYETGVSWIWDYAHSFDIGNDGITRTAENGKISSARILDTKYDYARTGWAYVSTGIWSRVSGFYYAHSGVHSSYTGCPLIQYPMTKRVTKNQCVGEISYNYEYTNSPDFYSGYTYSKEQSISYDSDRNSIVSENGEIQGYGPNRTGRYSLVTGKYFSDIKPSVSGNVWGIYYNSLTLLSTGCLDAKNLTLIESDESFKEWDGNISYNFSYSDSLDYVNTSSIFKVTQTISDQKPVHLVNYFDIVNDKQIAQTSTQSTLGRFSNDIKIIGKSGVTKAQLLTYATDRVIKPTGYTDVYITDCAYSYSPYSNNFDFSIEYAYSNYRTINNVIL